MTAPEIQTRRLKLIPLRAADARAFFAYRGDPEVCRYQTFEPRTLGDAEKFIGALESIAYDSSDSWFQLGIRLQESDLLIGDLGLHFMAEGSRQVELGVTLAPAHQGQGFGTEAVTGLLDHLFGVLRKHRVLASVDPRNRASIALLERVGMRKEAHFRESLWFKGEWVDDVVFAVLHSEWSGR